MEKKHRCKLCLRKFANGRALGGHMRSHMMKFYAEEKAARESGESEQESYSLPSSSSSEEEYVMREKSAGEGEGEGEGESESETESSTKRVRGTRISVFEVKEKKARLENEQSPAVSSISISTPEENVAHCLIMLSRDTWRKVETDNKFRRKYRCEECNKLFRSYQALGGHRASHKKIKPAPPPPPPEKLHQCPFCDRVFSSGQALGGHKRSHFVGAAPIQRTILTIDLNLPAPLEDDQLAISALSDAEFVNNQ